MNTIKLPHNNLIWVFYPGCQARYPSWQLMCYVHSSTRRIGQALSLLWSSSPILMTHVLWMFSLFHIQRNFYVSPHEEYYYSYLYYIQFIEKINLLIKKIFNKSNKKHSIFLHHSYHRIIFTINPWLKRTLKIHRHILQRIINRKRIYRTLRTGC